MAITLTQGKKFVDTLGKTQVAQFNPNTGAALKPGESAAVIPGGTPSSRPYDPTAPNIYLSSTPVSAAGVRGSTTNQIYTNNQLSSSITSQSLAPQSAVNIPSSSYLQGATGGIGAVAGIKAAQKTAQEQADKYDPMTGELLTDKKDKSEDFFKQYLANLESNQPTDTAALYEKAQRDSGIMESRQSVNNFQAQLNTITAQAEADQLSVTGQGRGIPEPIILGQQSQIAKEAAIKALPIAAQLSAAQGNLALAEQHLETRFSLMKQDAQNKYEYKNKLFGAVYEFATTQEKKRLDFLKTTNDRQYSEHQDFLDVQNKLLLSAVTQGAPRAIVNAITNAQSAQEAITAAGQYAAAPQPGFELSAGQTRYDAQGNVVASRPDKGSVGGGASGGGAMGGGVTGGPLSPISQSVVSNPSLFYNFTPTQKGQIVAELQGAGYDISGLQNSKLTAGQQDDIAQMNTVSNLIGDILSYNSDGKLEGIGGFGLGTIKQLGAQVGIGGKEGQAVRALIGNIKGTIAKLRGGTSFTTNEEKLLDTYTPSINDNPAVAMNKLGLLQDFIAQKNADLLNAARLNITSGSITKPGDATVDTLRAKYSY